MTLNKKIVWPLAIVLTSVFLIGALLLFVNRTPQKTQLPQVESEGPGTVVIDNTEVLGDILLDEQYTAVVDKLVNYIQTEIDNQIIHAAIEGIPQINPDGSVSFSVKTDNPTRQFTLLVDRHTYFDKIIFKVPSTGYSQTIQVY